MQWRISCMFRARFVAQPTRGGVLAVSQVVRVLSVTTPKLQTAWRDRNGFSLIESPVPLLTEEGRAKGGGISARDWATVLCFALVRSDAELIIYLFDTCYLLDFGSNVGFLFVSRDGSVERDFAIVSVKMDLLESGGKRHIPT